MLARNPHHAAEAPAPLKVTDLIWVSRFGEVSDLCINYGEGNWSEPIGRVFYSMRSWSALAERDYAIRGRVDGPTLSLGFFDREREARAAVVAAILNHLRSA